mgnify:CR=1 FL=1
MKAPLRSILVAALLPLILNGCISEQEHQKALAVITALPQEVNGCTFIKDLDSVTALLVDGARFNLRLQASRVNATHIVTQFVYPRVVSRTLLGVAMSGRAYRCPPGLGPKTDTPPEPYEIPSAEMMFPDRY